VRNIFIYGINSLTGSHFAARCLQTIHDHVFYLPCKPDALSAEETTDVVLHAASQIAGGELSLANRQEIANRLHRVSRDFEVYALGRTGATCIDELWYFVSAIVERNQAETLESLISACPRIGAQEFNYVAVDDPGSDPGRRNCKFIRSRLPVYAGESCWYGSETSLTIIGRQYPNKISWLLI